MRIRPGILPVTLAFLLVPLVVTGTVSSTASWEDPLRGIPLITSYDVPPTRHNGEVWGFAPAGAGQVWVGSDELFLFNGESREKISLPFETYAVRGLANDATGKLWIGAIGEIGHLEQTGTGGWRYVSAREALRTAGIDKVRVWQAQETPEGVVFVTDDHVLRWNGTRFEKWPIKAGSMLRPTSDRGTLWILALNAGLFRMEAGGPQNVFAASDLPSPDTVWAVGRAEGNKNEPRLVGGATGIYRREAGGWKLLDRLSEATKGKTSWCACMLDSQTVAIGTLGGGVVIGTADDRVLAVIDRASGLPNQSVTSLWLDERSNQLWIGYVGGMSRVDARGTVSVFDSRNGLRDAPAIKTLAHGDRTYVLARQAVSIFERGREGRPATAQPIATPTITLSDAISTGQNLWLGGLSGGLWRVAGDSIRQETPFGGFVFSLAEAKVPGSELLFLENSRLKSLVPRAGGGWEPRDLDIDLGAFAISTAQTSNSDLWISTVTHGIFRYHIDPASTQAPVHLVRHYRSPDGLPAEDIKRPVLTPMGNKVFALSETRILGYDATTDRFLPVPGLEHYVALAGTPTDSAGTAYWVVRNTALDPAGSANPTIIRLTDSGAAGSPSWEPVDSSGLDLAGRISGISYTDGDSPALWVAGSQMLLRLSIRSLGAPPPPPALVLRSIVRNGIDESLSSARQLQFGADTLRLRLVFNGVKSADGRQFLVQSLLENVSSDWSRPQTDPAFEFTGLRPGTYTFQAHTMDRYGRTGPAITLTFSIASPWYWSVAAILIYVVAGALAIAASMRWRLRHLHLQNVRLNQLVEERTAELARANVARNDFLEAISHEIRNPLNGITNLVDLLHDAELNPEAQKLAGSLGRSAAHLKQVFGSVLDYTKLEYGHVDIERTVFSLQPLLEDAIALFAVQAREQKNEIRLGLPPDFADGFDGDANKIQSVVSNYISNALKYSPGTTIEVNVRVLDSDTDNQTRIVWIGVCDKGPGMSQGEQEKLFKKFTRGADAKARGIMGTGLGLAICRSVAELLDGKVGVSSEPGQGSTFWLQVPLKRAAPPHSPAVAADPAKDHLPAPNTADALIVDDQEYNQAVLRGIAQRLGYRTEVASCADDVWPLIERVKFSAVLLDWELPGLSGGDIARRLRQHPNTRDAAIIATTAHDSADIVQKCLDAGMDGFAAKPFDTLQLREIVNAAIVSRAGRLRAPLPTPTHPPFSQPHSGQITLTAFADFAAGDPTRARQAVTLYLETLDQEVAALSVAIGASDREGIARRAHRLRSHAGLVNGIALNTAAQKLVVAARGDSPSAWRGLTDAVFGEAAALKAEINRLAAGPSTRHTTT
jgi:signal transduction histidine kinase/DNA-binding response OmpR family regulator